MFDLMLNLREGTNDLIFVNCFTKSVKFLLMRQQLLKSQDL